MHHNYAELEIIFKCRHQRMNIGCQRCFVGCLETYFACCSQKRRWKLPAAYFSSISFVLLFIISFSPRCKVAQHSSLLNPGSFLPYISLSSQMPSILISIRIVSFFSEVCLTTFHSHGCVCWWFWMVIHFDASTICDAWTAKCFYTRHNLDILYYK